MSTGDSESDGVPESRAPGAGADGPAAFRLTRAATAGG